jgi:hypothetical protein
MSWQCPTKGKTTDDAKKNLVRGRVYTLDAEEVDNSNNLIQGLGEINAKPINTVFDSGASHSFISMDCTKRVYFPISKIPYEVLVSTPSKNKINTTCVCSTIFLNYQDKTFCLDLYCLPMKGLDMILGMDWLDAHKVKIDCAARTVHILDRNLEVYCTHHPTFDLQNLSVFDDGPRFNIFVHS